MKVTDLVPGLRKAVTTLPCLPESKVERSHAFEKAARSVHAQQYHTKHA